MKCAVVAFAAVLALAAGCGQDHPDPPDVAKRKLECKALDEHLFRISPQAHLTGLPDADQRKRLAELQADVPIEDIEQCAAADPKVLACLQAAGDVAAVKACIPPATE